MRRGRALVTRLLRWYWVVSLFVGEVFLFYWHVRSCKWPSKTNAGVEPVHVAIVADPQIVDHYSYGQTGALLKTVEFFTDIYLRKSYRFLQTLREPEATIFLGDLMDGGREWGDKQWMEEYQRYNSIFYNRNPAKMKVYDMAGNHDIGIGNTIVDSALGRFHKYIGPTNQIIDLADHQIVLLDTLTLESDSGSVNRSSRELVERLKGQPAGSKNRILFSHVPLWRPDKTYCGPKRQSKDKFLLNRRGYQFRDQLFENTTRWLLESIKPQAIFSGDDHDTCTIEHKIPHVSSLKATEYTIGAFGWASGVPIASYGLLTLYPQHQQSKPTFLVENCYLPYQLGIYKFYIANFIVSVVLVAIVSYSEIRSKKYTMLSLSRSPSPPSGLPNPASAADPFKYKLFEYTPTSSTTKGVAVLFFVTFKDVAIVALPVFIACILYFYLF
ncbi:hypothetical protein GGI12_000431 [Dipsacomyces acuminosporus]|nr:hypothetical protein GGI12_000431 [Dipsacomyces acuminosporus]